MVVRREQECCPFLGFTIREDRDTLNLVIEAPENASEAADALFGTYTATRHSGEIDTAQDCREARDVLEFMTEGDGNILGIRATGKLSDEDYQHVLAPRVQSLLEQFHTLTFKAGALRRRGPTQSSISSTAETSRRSQ